MDAAHTKFSYLKTAAPASLLVLTVAVLASFWWSSPSLGFMLLVLLAGVGISAVWDLQLQGKATAALYAVLVTLLTFFGSLGLSEGRFFPLVFVQGIGTSGAIFCVYVLLCRFKGRH